MVPQTKRPGTVSTVKTPSQLLKQIDGLRNGREVRAVVRKSGPANTYKLSINGQEVTVRLNSEQQLSKGDRILLKVEARNNRVQLRILEHLGPSNSQTKSSLTSLPIQNATSSSIANLLQQLGLQNRSENRAVLNNMLKFKLPVTRNVFDNISQMLQSLQQTKSSTPFVSSTGPVLAGLLQSGNLQLPSEQLSLLTRMLTDSPDPATSKTTSTTPSLSTSIRSTGTPGIQSAPGSAPGTTSVQEAARNIIKVLQENNRSRPAANSSSASSSTQTSQVPNISTTGSSVSTSQTVSGALLNEIPTTVQQQLQTLVQGIQELVQSQQSMSVDTLQHAIQSESGASSLPSTSVTSELIQLLDQKMQKKPSLQFLDQIINTLRNSLSGDQTSTTSSSTAQEVNGSRIIQHLTDILNRVQNGDQSVQEAVSKAQNVIQKIPDALQSELVRQLQQMEKQVIQQDSVLRGLTKLIQDTGTVESSKQALRILEILQSDPGERVFWVRIPAGEGMSEPGLMTVRTPKQIANQETKDESSSSESEEAAVTTVGIYLNLSRLGTVRGTMKLADDRLQIQLQVRDRPVQSHLQKKQSDLEERLDEVRPALDVDFVIDIWDEKPDAGDVIEPDSTSNATGTIDVKV